MRDLDRQLFQAEMMRRLFGRHTPVRLGRYVVERRVAEGGGGRLYRGYDPQLDRPVAIKVPLADDATVARLRREARLLAGLQHFAVVSVFDVVELPEGLALVLAWVEGGTLAQWERAPERTATEIFDAYVAAGRGLCAVHRRGLVHRDFKPDNVLMTPTGPQLCDFGLARTTDAQLGVGVPAVDAITEGGAVPGTPAFMSPEQLRGHVSARGDQYSWSLALSEALRRLGDRADSRRLRRRIDTVLGRGLHPSVDERFDSLDVLLDALEARRSRPRLRPLWASAAMAMLAFCVPTDGLAGARVEQPHRAAEAAEASDALEDAVAEALADFEGVRARRVSPAAAVRSLERAYALAHEAEDETSTAAVATHLARLNVGLAELDSAQSWLAAARSAIARGDLRGTPVAAGAWIAEATLSRTRRDLRAARVAAMRGLELLSASDDPALRARGLMIVSHADEFDGLDQQALASLLNARAILEAADRRDAHEYSTVLLNLTLRFEDLGRWDEHAQVSRDVLESCPAAAPRCTTARMHALLNLAKHVPEDDWEAFERLTSEAMDVAKTESTAEFRHVSPIYYEQALRRRNRGELDEAERLLTRAIDDAAESSRMFMPSLLRLRAEVRLDQGRFDDAARDAGDLASLGGDEDLERSHDLMVLIESKRARG